MPKPAIIAVIDDSKFMRGLIVQAFNQLLPQARIVEFASAGEALDKLPQLQPELITVDLLMPGLSGVDFIDRLATLGPLPRVIVITADVQAAVRARCAAAGARAFVEKPVTLDKLRLAVATALVP